MNNPFPDFSETRLSAGAGVLTLRFGEPMDIELAASELRLGPDQAFGFAPGSAP